MYIFFSWITNFFPLSRFRYISSSVIIQSLVKHCLFFLYIYKNCFPETVPNKFIFNFLLGKIKHKIYQKVWIHLLYYPRVFSQRLAKLVVQKIIIASKSTSSPLEFSRFSSCFVKRHSSLEPTITNENQQLLTRTNDYSRLIDYSQLAVLSNKFFLGLFETNREFVFEFKFH